MHFSILTIFPDFFVSPLQEGIVRKAVQEDKVKIAVHNIRDFAVDRHRVTDDRPFGGGEGMVMKPEPLAACLQAVNRTEQPDRVVLLSPKGVRFTQQQAERLTAYRHLLLVCGRYEGVDERFREKYVDEELSLGDYILTGGELAALVVLDAVCRLLPGVLGCEESATKDSFSRGLLKHGQYTRPRLFEGVSVPEVLLSGDHAAIERFRFLESVKLTMERRPELLMGMSFSPDEEKLLQREGLRSRIDAITRGNREKSHTA
ncbi:tRNA (guanosine(37)-N1)-methyltransferase TrmD [Desulfobulbus oligotrophicus]|uniref:tRNA (guanine-N(1)-)-methyltransferase n=1 Tax=Desulfobulbus oligotrophicus TaxID=1909699 RepID=A0A7T5VFC0_9BACT|nr:tRNA (guanosine(37)-N1)-methyltransferase TrmD [Desulfobulbus oligotrophicus]QQG66885.1 tRNA (guanosine(37)-N1)-methyltransferase TrmD [Desulfobulbus oligotrophicus]